MTLAERPMKVLVVWELGANLGHLLRLRPVVQALKRRGHVVVMAVPDPDAARSLLDVAGVECIACPMVRPRGSRAQPEREVRCYADILAEYAFGDGPALARTLGEWAALLGVVRPDALLIEFAPLALLVARLHRLPAVHVAIGWEAPPAGDTLPLIRQGHPGDKEAAVALEAVLVGRINEHCAAAGVEPLKVLSDLYASARQLMATLPETDHFGPRDTVEYIGPLYSSDYGTVVAWPVKTHKNIRRVFVYLQPARINIDVMKELRAMQATVIAVLPSANPDAIARVSNEQVQVYNGPVKLAGLLEQADLVITNAGHGLVAASILAGKPMLLIPQNYEQTLLAGQVLATGAAQVLPKQQELSLGALSLAIQGLLGETNSIQAVKSIQVSRSNAQMESVLKKLVDALDLVPDHRYKNLMKL
jgi:UDP:flavonoid glycosyltransferase YjiC (YdhE family)